MSLLIEKRSKISKFIEKIEDEITQRKLSIQCQYIQLEEEEPELKEIVSRMGLFFNQIQICKENIRIYDLLRKEGVEKFDSLEVEVSSNFYKLLKILESLKNPLVREVFVGFPEKIILKLFEEYKKIFISIYNKKNTSFFSIKFFSESEKIFSFIDEFISKNITQMSLDIETCFFDSLYWFQTNNNFLINKKEDIFYIKNDLQHDIDIENIIKFIKFYSYLSIQLKEIRFFSDLFFNGFKKFSFFITNFNSFEDFEKSFDKFFEYQIFDSETQLIIGSPDESLKPDPSCSRFDTFFTDALILFEEDALPLNTDD